MASLDFPKLEKEIYQKFKIYSKTPEYHLKRKKSGSSNMTSKKYTDEWMIEHPNMQKLLISIKNSKKSKTNKKKEITLKKEIKEGKERIKTAWRNLKEVNLNKIGLNHTILLNLGKDIDEYNESYRRQRVSLGMHYTPPNPLKVYQLLNNFFEEYNNFKGSKLELGLLSHVVIGGIQPFYDGNKRCARMIQNKTLAENHLPIVSIPYGERKIYISLLEEAMKGLNFYNEMPEHNKENFDKLFTYLGGKINTSLDNIIKNI